MSDKLTTTETGELLRIASYYPKAAGDFPSPTLAALERRGLIRRFKEFGPLGGGGAIGAGQVEWRVVELTDAGWLALKAAIDGTDEPSLPEAEEGQRKERR